MSQSNRLTNKSSKTAKAYSSDDNPWCERCLTLPEVEERLKQLNELIAMTTGPENIEERRRKLGNQEPTGRLFVEMVQIHLAILYQIDRVYTPTRLWRGPEHRQEGTFRFFRQNTKNSQHYGQLLDKRIKEHKDCQFHERFFKVVVEPLLNLFEEERKRVNSDTRTTLQKHWTSFLEICVLYLSYQTASYEDLLPKEEMVHKWQSQISELRTKCSFPGSDLSTLQAVTQWPAFQKYLESSPAAWFTYGGNFNGFDSERLHSFLRLEDQISQWTTDTPHPDTNFNKAISIITNPEKLRKLSFKDLMDGYADCFSNRPPSEEKMKKMGPEFSVYSITFLISKFRFDIERERSRLDSSLSTTCTTGQTCFYLKVSGVALLAYTRHYYDSIYMVEGNNLPSEDVADRNSLSGFGEMFENKALDMMLIPLHNGVFLNTKNAPIRPYLLNVDYMSYFHFVFAYFLYFANCSRYARNGLKDEAERKTAKGKWIRHLKILIGQFRKAIFNAYIKPQNHDKTETYKKSLHPDHSGKTWDYELAWIEAKEENWPEMTVINDRVSSAPGEKTLHSFELVDSVFAYMSPTEGADSQTLRAEFKQKACKDFFNGPSWV